MAKLLLARFWVELNMDIQSTVVNRRGVMVFEGKGIGTDQRDELQAFPRASKLIDEGATLHTVDLEMVRIAHRMCFKLNKQDDFCGAVAIGWAGGKYIRERVSKPGRVWLKPLKEYRRDGREVLFNAYEFSVLDALAAERQELSLSGNCTSFDRVNQYFPGH